MTKYKIIIIIILSNAKGSIGVPAFTHLQMRLSKITISMALLCDVARVCTLQQSPLRTLDTACPY